MRLTPLCTSKHWQEPPLRGGGLDTLKRTGLTLSDPCVTGPRARYTYINAELLNGSPFVASDLCAPIIRIGMLNDKNTLRSTPRESRW